MALGSTISARGDSTVQVLDFDTALAGAVENNPLLAGLREQIEAAQARTRLAGSLPDPRLKYSYFGESVQTRTGSQEAIYSLSQTLPWLPKLSQQREIAGDDVAILEWAEQQAYDNLRRDTAQVFAEVNYLDRAVDATRKSLDLLNETEQVVRASVQTGGSVNSLLRLAVERERVQDDLERFERELSVQRHQLEAILASDLDESVRLKPLPSVQEQLPAKEVLQGEMLRANPELQALARICEQAARKVSLERQKRYPDVTVGVNYIELDAADSTHSRAGEDPWSLTVEVNLPIWEGRNRASILDARATRRAEEQRYRNRQIQLRAELGSILARLADDLRREKRYREDLIPLASQALENSRSAYEAGAVGIIELLDSERALLDLTIVHARAHADSIQNQSRLDALVRGGGPRVMKPLSDQ